MVVNLLEADIKKLERKITNIENVMFENGSSANCVAQLKETRTELDTAQLSLKTAKTQLAQSMTDTTIKKMVARMSAALRGLDDLEMDDQKVLMSTFIERIELAHIDGDTRIIFKFKVGIMESELEATDAAPDSPEDIKKLLDVCSRTTARGRSGSHTKMASSSGISASRTKTLERGQP